MVVIIKVIVCFSIIRYHNLFMYRQIELVKKKRKKQAKNQKQTNKLKTGNNNHQ